MFEIAFLKAASKLDNAISPWEFAGFYWTDEY